MTKARTLLLLLLAASIGFVSAQDVPKSPYDTSPTAPLYDATEGSMYRHIYSTAVYYAPATSGTETTASTLSINKTMVVGLFDTTETLNYATALTRLDYTSVDTVAQQLILEVVNVTVNSARSQFTINLKFTRNEIATFSKYTQLGFNVIFFGSKFGIESSPIPTGFARNSKLVAVTDIATAGSVDAAQFDFAGNQGEPSPFAYVPSAAESRCGVSQAGSQARIQVLGCQKPIILTFITGFVHEKANVAANIDIESFVVADNTAAAANPNNLNIISPLTTNVASANYIYQATPTDTIVGPTVIFESGNVATALKRIQLALVFIGMRTLTALTYPTGIPDSYIVAVGGLNYGTAGASTASSLTTTATAMVDALKSTTAVGTTLNLKDSNYNGGTTTRMGHEFCGFTSIVLQAKARMIQAFDTAPGTAIPQIGDTINTAGTSFSSGACLLVATKASCVNSEKQVLSTAAPAITTTTGVTVTNNALTINAATQNKALYTFALTGYAAIPSTTTTIIKNYAVPAGRTELTFYLEIVPESPAGTTVIPTASSLSYILNIGGVEYPLTYVPAPATAAPYDRQIVIHVPAGTTNLPVNITYMTTSGSATTVSTIRSGVYYYENVIDNNQACGSTCQEVANKTTGVTIATNPPVCIYCSNDLFQVYDNNTGTCICKPSYTRDATTLLCAPCTDPLCVTCSPASTCTVCSANSTLSGGATPSCQCNVGFYRNGSSCVPCPIGCAACTSPTACTACKDSTNATGFVTRLTETSNCRCLDGFYETNVSAVCLACNPSCATCAVTANNCTSCNASLNFILQQNSCVCAAGYYLLNNACAQCSPICTTCAVSSVYCLSCPELRVLAGTTSPQYKTCSCNTTAGYVEIDYVCVDATCKDIDPNCQTCAIEATGLRIRECLNCVDNRIVIQGRCVCKPGYFEGVNGKCAPCGAGCQSCTSANVCNVCATRSVANGDGTCTCRPGTLIISFSSTLYCQSCDINCATCSVSPSNCTSCKTGFVKSTTSNTCICPSGTYLSPDGTQCFACMANCLSCSDSTSCSNCAAGYIYDSTAQQCALNCPDGQFNAGVDCKPCPTGCSSCYTESICSSCIAGYSMFAGSCRTVCPDSTYSLNSQCYPCDSKCKTCSSPTVCNSCAAPYVLFANRCVSDCQPGTFYADGSCRACNLASCLTCTGNADNCLSCPSPKILYNGACYTTCPVATVNGVCTPTCPAGSFLSGTTCAPCDSTCRTCFGTATNCTSCASGLSSDGICVNSCPAGSLASAGFCVSCDPSCRTCSITPYSCDECAAGFIRSGANCIKNCAAGFYIDPVARTCNPCGSGCETCVSSTQCTRCLDPTTTAINGVCQKVCPSGASLIGGNCVCNFGVLHQSTCVTSCPEGFYAAPDRTCALCSSPCLGCSGTSTSCSSCVAGFTLNPATRTCSRASTCPYGAYLNSNGQCVNICLTGFFYAGGCVFSCPNGFTANANRGCVQSVTPTFCQTPLFQQGNACVATCLAGFYPNTVTRTCDRCFANCAQCLSASVCVTCSQGFTLNAAQTACVASSTCPPNQFSYNSACYTQCPVGTYVSNSFCVRSCRAGLYFYQNYCYPGCPTPFFSADACFVQCPAGVTCQVNP